MFSYKMKKTFKNVDVIKINVNRLVFMDTLYL